MDKMQEYAKAYGKLLALTKEKCQECKGKGWTLSNAIADTTCFVCHGTGKGKPNPERIVVLAGNQDLPDNPAWHKNDREYEAFCAGINILIQNNWMKVIKE